MEKTPLVEKIEEVAPLYDLVRFEYFNVFTAANKLYGELSATYTPPKKNTDGSPSYEDVMYLSRDFVEFKKLIHRLFGLLASDITYKSKARPVYGKLLELRETKEQHSITDYFEYHLLFRHFLGDLGLFKITNISYKTEPTAAAFRGIADD